MLSQFKIGPRLIIGFVMVILLFAAAVVPISLSKISELIELSEQSELHNLHKSALAEVSSEGRTAYAIATTMANSAQAQQAMKDNDRARLSDTVSPIYAQLKSKFDVRQLQFHTPPATSFFRAHKPEKFGDDLSSFRKTVVKVNQSKQSVVGLERGVAGLGIRGIAPVEYEERHIGSVEAGMSFGQPFFDQFKKKYNVDISLYVFDDSGGAQTFASTLGEPLLTSQDINQAKNNDEASFTVKVGDKEFAVLAKTIEDFSGEKIGVISIARDRAKFMALYNQAALTVLVVCLVAFAGVIILARFIAVSISGPINDAATAMMGIAEGDGDLTQRLPVKGQDEVAMMSSGFNLFAQKVQKSLITVTESTNVLSSSAEEMSYITQETRDGVRIQQNETEQVATAMNQMTTTVQEVAQNATEASTFAKNADAQAEQGQSIVNQAIQTIVALADDINRAVEVVSKVEKDSEKIGSVVDVIRGIAEQTNLLALNAAIEAARAGEQGRGFAVVADEVRTLASRTQSSTQEIESMIEQLQIGTREAASAMNNSKDASQNSVVHAEKAGVALEEITKAVKSISDMNIQIATAAEEQGAVSEEINKNIVNINDIGNRSYEGTEQTHSASVQLTDLASKLQSLLAQFKLR